MKFRSLAITMCLAAVVNACDPLGDGSVSLEELTEQAICLRKAIRVASTPEQKEMLAEQLSDVKERIGELETGDGAVADALIEKATDGSTPLVDKVAEVANENEIDVVNPCASHEELREQVKCLRKAAKNASTPEQKEMYQGLLNGAKVKVGQLETGGAVVNPCASHEELSEQKKCLRKAAKNASTPEQKEMYQELLNGAKEKLGELETGGGSMLDASTPEQEEMYQELLNGAKEKMGELETGGGSMLDAINNLRGGGR